MGVDGVVLAGGLEAVGKEGFGGGVVEGGGGGGCHGGFVCLFGWFREWLDRRSFGCRSQVALSFKVFQVGILSFAFLDSDELLTRRRVWKGK